MFSHTTFALSTIVLMVSWPSDLAFNNGIGATIDTVFCVFFAVNLIEGGPDCECVHFFITIVSCGVEYQVFGSSSTFLFF